MLAFINNFYSCILLLYIATLYYRKYISSPIDWILAKSSPLNIFRQVGSEISEICGFLMRDTKCVLIRMWGWVVSIWALHPRHITKNHIRRIYVSSGSFCVSVNPDTGFGWWVYFTHHSPVGDGQLDVPQMILFKVLSNRSTQNQTNLMWKKERNWFWDKGHLDGVILA